MISLFDSAEQREALQERIEQVLRENSKLRNQISSLNAKIHVLRRTIRRIDEMYSADEIVAVDEILYSLCLEQEVFDKQTQTSSCGEDEIHNQSKNGTPLNAENIQTLNSLCQSLNIGKSTKISEYIPSIHSQDWLRKTLWRIYQEHAYSNSKIMEQRGKRRRFAEFLSGYFLQFSGSVLLSEKVGVIILNVN